MRSFVDNTTTFMGQQCIHTLRDCVAAVKYHLQFQTRAVQHRRRHMDMLCKEQVLKQDSMVKNKESDDSL